ncbi:hypothetical protein Y032_0029g1840 [Ancylostoma ceylanicum]|uniref:Uncharacterized protein n=1 Tax=Ancylostoma ceylanicum TaxID=53326 RepID=A0A016UTC0_9BILA|nr:hypothetical protein Y032_0029g1840 [Ancylostoma ceylanicum]
MRHAFDFIWIRRGVERVCALYSDLRGASDEPSQCFIFPDSSGTNLRTREGWTAWLAGGRDRTIDRARAQRASYHCATGASSNNKKRRVDRCTQMLLLLFSSVAIAISCAIFLESAMIINKTCTPSHCEQKKLVVHAILVLISLSELLTCLCTFIICYRSLRGAVAVYKAYSPYSTLIIGDYETLKRPDRIFRPSFAYRPTRVLAAV